MTDASNQLIFISEHLALIHVAEECWRPIDPDHAWHVLEWMCWKQRCKLPLMRKCDMVINMNYTGT
jgi:hypothetical protein